MSMTTDEVIDLLSVIVHYDNRNADSDEVIRAWTKAAEVARWTLEEAVEAVHQHFANRTEWLMPGHVTAHIRAAREDAASRAVVPAQRQAITGQGRRVLEMAQQLADAKAIEPSGDVAHRRSPRSVKCPFCSALPGQQCTRPSRRGATVVPDHSSRIEAAQDAPAKEAQT